MKKKPDDEQLNKVISSLRHEIELGQKREATLRRDLERLGQIIESIPIPIVAIDKNHLVTHYNRAMENLSGISADIIKGTQNQWKAFYKAQRPIMADFIVDKATEEKIARYYGEKFSRSLVKEGAFEAEDFFPDIGEKGKWLFFTAAPLMDSEGNIFGAVETLQDTTERKHAEEELIKSEQRFRTLLDVAPYAIVVFNMDGLVIYLNPAFTETFGWSFEELRGQRIPYVPEELKKDVTKNVQRLVKEKIIPRHETRRLTKDGRTLDVVMRASVISDSRGEPAGELVIIRDVTREKRIARNNEAMLRISMALPEYFELYDLFNYVSSVIKELVGTEGGVALLLDEPHQELFFMGVAFEDTATEERVKEIRFSLDELVAGQVINTGQPMILNDISKSSEIHAERDRRLGYETRNLLLVPLRSQDRVIGVLCAINKKDGDFNEADVELLSMLAGTAVLSIENARFAEEVKRAYMEVSSLNRKKDKIINLLSHEIRTPIAVLNSTLVSIEKKMKAFPEKTWKPTLERARRNLDRLLQIQYRVDDVMGEKAYKVYDILSRLVEQCKDELEALVVETVGEESVIERIRDRINEEFGPKNLVSEKIHLASFVKERLDHLRSAAAHRQVDLQTQLEETPLVYIPREPLDTIIGGLVKNAIENTPDEGRVKIMVRPKDDGSALEVIDFGVGITEENQSRIFEGFYATQETMDYSSRRPFDFNAGGRGADLLRIKVFSERYNFKIEMQSTRCVFIPKDSDLCPGKISQCPYCRKNRDCHRCPATTFSLFFPPAP
jgi:PAS domain S-box-containing protein